MTLSLNSTALLDVSSSAAGTVADRAGVLTGQKAIVLTQPARTSLETQSARDGAFSVARIVLR
jgi:hypothetical protein